MEPKSRLALGNLAVLEGLKTWEGGLQRFFSHAWCHTLSIAIVHELRQSLRESLHGMIWRNRLLPRKDSWLPQHAYILPPSSRLGSWGVLLLYFLVCFLLTPERSSFAPRGHSRCSLFLQSFTPSSIKICFAGNYFVSYGIFWSSNVFL